MAEQFDEYERSRTMAASSEIVFQVASEIETMDRWLTTMTDVSEAAPEVLHVEGDVGGRHYEAEGLYAARPEQLRMEWGSRDTDDYSGWLQVADSGAGASETTIHLSFRGVDRPPADEVEKGLDAALGRLADQVRTRVDDAG
jgi:uncharacterized protein YndB with AHSA1/START domain